MKDQTNEFYRQCAAMKKAMDETPEHLRYPSGAKVNPDKFCEAVWWLGFLVCLAVLIYGTLSL